MPARVLVKPYLGWSAMIGLLSKPVRYDIAWLAFYRSVAIQILNPSVNVAMTSPGTQWHGQNAILDPRILSYTYNQSANSHLFSNVASIFQVLPLIYGIFRLSSQQLSH